MPPKKNLAKTANSTPQPKKKTGPPRRKSLRKSVTSTDPLETTPSLFIDPVLKDELTQTNTETAIKQKKGRPRKLSNEIKIAMANEDPVIKDELTQTNTETAIKQKKGRPRKLSNKIKIAMANEVEQTQFSKKCTIIKTAVAPKLVSKKPNLKRKYTKTKNIVDKGTELVQDTTVDANQEDDSSAPKRKRIVRKNSNSKLAITVDNHKDISPPKELKPALNSKRKFSLGGTSLHLLQGLVRTVVNDYVRGSNTRFTVGNAPSLEKDTTPVEEDTPSVEKDTPSYKKDTPLVKKDSSSVKKKTQNQITTVNELALNKNTYQVNRVKNNENDEGYSRCSSEISWTKDMCSSSATTCVTVMSNDFFRIDNKIPLIQLPKLSGTLPKQRETEESIDTSDTSSESDSSTDSSNRDTVSDMVTNNLNLSASSSSKKSTLITNKISVHQQIVDVLKTFNPDNLNWTSGLMPTVIGIRKTDQFKEKLVKENVLQDEMTLLSLCLNITNLASEESHNSSIMDEINKGCDRPIENQERIEESITSRAEIENDIYRTKHVENDDDDVDDALSLYAESITGIDTSQRSNSFTKISETPVVEEYIPRPVAGNVFKKPNPVTYNPSRVDQHKRTDYTLNICEKQSADSTSIRNDFDDVTVDICQTSSESSKLINDQPIKFFSINNIRPIELVKSTVFRGVCVFNLLAKCKKVQCMFPHNYLGLNEIKNRLERLSDDMFIQEYLMLRRLIQLRRLYELCYVNDCVRRKLTRFLVEISMDFTVKTTDACHTDIQLKTEAAERTLLYLNFVDLSLCADLLEREINPGELLCDVYLNVIAKSQNFYRFRTIFINLTVLMCRMGRTFDSHVASQILERVCILPYEFGLMRTLIEMLKKTDPIVLSHSMSGLLEKRLSGANKQLYEELVGLKQLVRNKDVQNGKLDKDVRYSPDTTNFDNTQNNLQEEFARPTDSNTTFNNPLPNFKNNRYQGHCGPRLRRRPFHGIPKGFSKRRALLKLPVVTLPSPTFTRRNKLGHILR